MEALRGLDPSVQVREHARWIVDGNLITSAGVSAGIDMALHLVARLAGRDRAWQVRCGIHHTPSLLCEPETVVRFLYVDTPTPPTA